MNKPMTPKEMEDWVGGTWDRCQKQAWSEPMNREEIIRMAREAGFEFPADYDLTELISRLERFAALVAAAEREACAKVCEEGGKDASGRIHVQAWGAAKAIRARGNT